MRAGVSAALILWMASVALAQTTAPASQRGTLPTTTPASMPTSSAAQESFEEPLPSGAIARFGTTRMAHLGQPWLAVMAPNKTVFATADTEGRIYMWDTFTGRSRWVTDRTRQSAAGMTFSPDGNYLAAAVYSNNKFEIQLFGVASGKPIATLEPMNNPATALAFTPDGGRLVVADSAGLRLYKVADQSRVAEIKALSNAQSMAVSSDGNTVAVGGHNGGNVSVCDLSEPNAIRKIATGAQSVLSLAFSPDGKHLAIGNTGGNEVIKEPNKPDRTARRPIGTIVVDALTGARVGAIDNVTVLQYLPDGKKFFAQYQAPNTGFRQLHEVDCNRWQSRNLGISLQHNGGAPQLTSADGSLMVFINQQNQMVRVRRIADAKNLINLPVQGQVQRLAVSPDGTRLAVANTAASFGAAGPQEQLPSVHIYDANGAYLQGLAGGQTGTVDVAFSRDGEFLAAAAGEPSIRIWRTSDWKLAEVKDANATGVYARNVQSLTFTAEGQLLFIGRDAGVGLLNPRTGRFGTIRPAYDPNYWQMARVSSGPVGRLAVIVAGWRTVLWDTAASKPMPDPLGLRDNVAVTSVSLSPTGLLLAVTGEADAVTLYEVSTRRFVRGLNGAAQFGSVGAMVSPNGRLVATGGTDAKVHLWDIDTGKEIAALAGHKLPVYAVAFAPDGRSLYSGSADKLAYRWDISRFAAPAAPAPSAEALAAAWEGLADANALNALRAQEIILASGDAGASLLADRVGPIVIDRAAVARCITELDAEEFETRQNASLYLGNLSDIVLPDLKAALAAATSEELKTRLQTLIERAGSPSIAGGSRLRLTRAVWLLELLGGEQGRRGLTKLAAANDASAIARDAKAALAALNATQTK